MTKEKFVEILKEGDYSDYQINSLWELYQQAPPTGDPAYEEKSLRETAKAFAPLFHEYHDKKGPSK